MQKYIIKTIDGHKYILTKLTNGYKVSRKVYDENFNEVGTLSSEIEMSDTPYIIYYSEKDIFKSDGNDLYVVIASTDKIDYSLQIEPWVANSLLWNNTKYTEIFSKGLLITIMSVLLLGTFIIFKYVFKVTDESSMLFISFILSFLYTTILFTLLKNINFFYKSIRISK